MEVFTVTVQDRAMGYDTSYAFATVGANALMIAGILGMGSIAAGSCTAMKVSRGIGAIQDSVSLGQGLADMIEKGPTIGNLAQVTLSGASLAANLFGLKTGGCFVAGTVVHVSSVPESHESQPQFSSTTTIGLKSDTYLNLSRSSGSGVIDESVSFMVPIESVPLGARVVTKNPRPDDYDHAFGQPDAANWMKVSFEVARRDGTIVDSELLRHRSWIESQDLSIGSQIPIFSDELEINGMATVVGLDASPPLADGDGEVITGRFVTRQVEQTVLMEFSNGQTLEGTTVHPIWSPEVEDWVPMSEFAEGDSVLGRDGWLTIRSIRFVHRTVPVYNLEVHGEHVYEVTVDVILVHNTGTCTTNPNQLHHPVPKFLGGTVTQSLTKLAKSIHVQ